MRVTVKDLDEKEKFKPYVVSFYIQTKEESTRFHDKVAIKIPKESTPFIGDIYSRGFGEEPQVPYTGDYIIQKG